jgi:hypothetical protein
MRAYALLADLATTFAAAEKNPLDPNDVKPGWVALGIVIILCFATFLLARSFLKHSKRADQLWEGEEDASRPRPTEREQ